MAEIGNKNRLIGEPYDRSLYSTRLYRIWSNMKTRCTNKKVEPFSRYGARGIKICDKWISFKGFLDDMQDGYMENLTIDRIDNNKGYYKENCRWATYKEQAQNTRNIERAKKFNIDNKDFTIRELSEKFGIKRTTLDMRLKRYNYDINKALIKRGVPSQT